ncbi:hypothetical protein [Bacillus sp. S2-R3J1-FB-BA1]|uniref:hypothetical protein n=1 Tax=Bacillus sp. S2-R3J1-FB-BA1 TaxID=1973490 RepID=UPI001120E610|nr:hypothetical protein [Bacillus sp. S2-R3J1-FB-BA1]
MSLFIVKKQTEYETGARVVGSELFIRASSWPSQDLLLSVPTDAATAALSLAAMTLGLLTAHGLPVTLRPRPLRAPP